ncbi:MAG: TrmH family RNA methyltransferase [Candidatus Micrarchaeia archaeon]
MKRIIEVLRLGHRKERDKRLTTHCALVARAFGARALKYTGERDESFEASVASVAKRWGGAFPVEHADSWHEVLEDARKRGFRVVHLTMYGTPFEKARLPDKLLVVVGGEKVESAVYHEVDWNLSVTQQPHSEAGALAVFLYARGKPSGKRGWEIKIEPRARGKRISRRIKGINS